MKASSKHTPSYPGMVPSVVRSHGARDMGGPDVDMAPLSTSHVMLPHERDEAVDPDGGVFSKAVEQAARDLSGGLLDTDRGFEMHFTYQKQKFWW